MSKYSYSCSFYLNKHKPKGDKLPLYVRIVVHRKKVEFSLKEYVSEEKWDVKTGRAIKLPSLNEKLLKVEKELSEVRREIELEGRVITAALIRDRYLGLGDFADTLLTDYISRFIQEMRLLKEDFSEGTLKNYIATSNHVTNFLVHSKKTKISLRQVDIKFIQDFDMYMLTLVKKNDDETTKEEQQVNRNSANKYHSKLKAILNKARKLELIKTNPYDHFKLKNQKSNRTFLTQEEIDLLKKKKFERTSLDRARDIFIFSVYTGLRFNDAMNLKEENISVDDTGNTWINFVQEKTGSAMSIPMLKYALDVYNKYKTQREITKSVLPKISNQKLNKHLKEVATAVNINKEITHHVARHTFATTVTLSNNVPIEIVSKMLGHSDLKTTAIYAKITNKYLGKVAADLNSII